MRRRLWMASELEADLVDPTPVPALLRLVGTDDGMTVGVEMSGGVPTGRLLATTDMATRLAGTKVHPIALAGGQTIFTTLALWDWIGYRVEVSAAIHAGEARSSDSDRQADGQTTVDTPLDGAQLLNGAVFPENAVRLERDLGQGVDAGLVATGGVDRSRCVFGQRDLRGGDLVIGICSCLEARIDLEVDMGPPTGIAGLLDGGEGSEAVGVGLLHSS